MNRYLRQEILPEVGRAGQDRLAAASVLVIGAGGLGSSLLPLLAGAGVGSVVLVDPDRVETGNLHRQILYRMDDLGRPKALAAADHLKALNPDCRVHAHLLRADPANLPGLAAGVDLVIDAADNFAISYALSDLCRASGQPLITASVLGRAGYVAGICGGAPSLRALFPDLPGSAQTCTTAGVMGPAVALLAALQAQMALSVLLRHDPSPLGQFLRCDLASWRSSGFSFLGAPETAGPAIIAGSQIRRDDLVVDLRDPEGSAPLPGCGAPGQRLVYVCTTGLRAWRAARAAMERGARDVAVIGDGG